MATVAVDVDELRALCQSALCNAGLTETEARVITSDYIEAEAAGRHSHGLAGFEIAVSDAHTRGHPRVIFDSAAVTAVNGNGEIGHLVLADQLPGTVEKARAGGVALLAVSHISRLASPGTLARRLAESQLASICLEYGGQAFVASPGRAEPVISTNPIAIGFPRAAHTPLVLDMATSSRAYFFIRLAETLGLEVPASWGVDDHGDPVTDPSRVHALSPLGGYKGFGLGFMIEVLTGPMLGVPAGLQGNLGVRGVLVIALDPAIFGRPLEAVSEDVERLIADLDGAPYPGEQSGTRLAKMAATGQLDVEDATLQRLRALATAN